MWEVWIPPSAYFTYLLLCRIWGGKLIKDFEWKKPKSFVIFQITTNGKNKHAVDESIKAIKQVCAKLNFTNYRIDVVTDEGCPTNYDANVIVVPKDYKPKHAKYKARALQYAVEWRRKREEKTANIWVFHLDDESIVTEHCLKAIAHHINNNKEPISEGFIIYSNKFKDAGIFSRLADCLRPPCCYECKFMTKYGWVTHLHGSNLLIRADVEDKIGWDFDTIAEDSLFGLEAIRQGYKIGWHYGFVIEQPVFTVKDLFKQRARWFKGGLQNLLRAKGLLKYLLALKLFAWFCGFPSWVIAIIYLIYPQNIPLIGKILVLPGTLTWVLSYQIGITHNKGTWKDRVLAVMLLPILGLIETIPAFFFWLFARKGFAVVKK